MKELLSIKKELSINLTRQAIYKRAGDTAKNKEKLHIIREGTLDLAEVELFGLMKSNSEVVRLNAIKYFLSCKGRSRGYGDVVVDSKGEVLTAIKLVGVKVKKP